LFFFEIGKRKVSLFRKLIRLAVMGNVEMQNSKFVGWGEDQIQMKLKQQATRKWRPQAGASEGGLYGTIEF
jgi:hypothetical protein